MALVDFMYLVEDASFSVSMMKVRLYNKKHVFLGLIDKRDCQWGTRKILSLHVWVSLYDEPIMDTTLDTEEE